MRRRPVVALALAAGLVLAGCGGATTTGGEPAAPVSSLAPTTAAPVGTAASDPGSAGPAVEVDGAAWAHVHTLALDGEQLLVGTHRGLFAQQPGAEPERVSDTAFDVMGLARDGDRLLASGHPAEGEDLPADLGLRESTDGGATWATVSLEGEVDFHRLVAANGTVMGMSAHDGTLLRSTDGGTAWDDLGTPPLFDLALDPSDPRVVVATTEQGPVRSTDGGGTFEPIDGAPLIAFLAWTGTTLYGLAPDGRIHVSDDSGATWSARGSVGSGQPAALAADGDTVVALAGTVVAESTDGGATFRARLSLHGAEGH